MRLHSRVRDGAMRRAHGKWRRRPIAIATGLSAALAVLPLTVTGVGSAAAAPVAIQSPVFTSAPTATIQTEDNDGYQVTADCTSACTFGHSGDLPPNVQISSGGLIQGDPPVESEGVYHFTITATDSTGAATQAFTLNVDQLAAIGVEGSDGQMWVQAPQLTPGWHPLGGNIIAPPAVAAPPASCCTDPSPPPVAPLFIALGSDGRLWMRSVTEGWQLIEPVAYCIGGPAATVTSSLNEPLTVTVACQGNDHELWENQDTSWTGSGLPSFASGWTNLGGGLAAGPAVGPTSGFIGFYVNGNDGLMWTRTLSSPYTPAPWRCIGQPNVTDGPGGFTSSGALLLETIFSCQGTDHTFWYAAFNDLSGWSPAASLGGDIVGSPTSAWASSAFEPVVEGSDHAVWVRTLSGNWVSLGGSVVGGVGAVALN